VKIIVFFVRDGLWSCRDLPMVRSKFVPSSSGKELEAAGFFRLFVLSLLFIGPRIIVIVEE